MAGDSILRNTESSWATFANTLTNDFKSQFGAQSAVFQQLTSKFTSMLQNPQGFSPQALSALRGGAVQQTATQFNQARQQVQANEATQGSFGGEVKSGVNAQINGQISAAQAGQTASGLDQIEQANETQKINNQNIALQGLSGVASMENPNGLLSGATGAAGETGSLGSAYAGTNSGGFGDSFKKGFGTALGNTLGGGNAKGDGTGSTSSQAAGFFGA